LAKLKASQEMNITKPILIFLLFVTATSFARVDTSFVSSNTKHDTTQANTRHFNRQTINELQADPDLKYESGPAAISLWQRFKIWLNNLLNKLFRVAATTDWGNILIAVLSIGIIVYVILRLLKVDALKMFYKETEKSPMRMAVIEENIHAMDFEKLLQEAIDKKEYRLAIRLQFLQALKILSDRHLIQWEPGKTNHDYINELSQQTLKSGFNELNFYFEYSWYGHFNVKQDLFNKVNNIFHAWRARIQ
jgi:hypothetical protein